jgi:Cu(I)/Ag(I) efflux system membrane protein CusA/SilA
VVTTIIEGVVRARAAVWLLVGAGTLVSLWVAARAPLDAIPDISDPQIVLYAKWPRSPQLLEAELVEPLVRALIGAPGVASVRATSHLGYSFIYVLLEDPSRRDEVSRRVADRINSVRSELPADATVTVGPNASSMGWIYQFALVDREGFHDLRDLRLLNENQIKPALEAVPGVAEVASVGGLEKQYQIKILPPLLAEAGITLKQLLQAIEGAFEEVGGRSVEITNRDYQIRGAVGSHAVDDIEFIIIGHRRDGAPVRVKDVGYIQVGYDVRRGIADLNGDGEVVGGIVIMEHEQNVLAVSRDLDAKIGELNAALPEGVEVVATYDRSSLIWQTLRHFFLTLAYELTVVIAVMLIALRNLRVAAAPVAILLLGALFTVLPLAAFRQTINLFSLAGLFIALGEMADATIVMVENCSAELGRRPELSARERYQIIVRSIAALARPLVFSLLIIITSFLPVFFLEEQEGRLFDPLAYTKTFAMAFSTLLTIFLLPILIVWAFKPEARAEQAESERLITRLYRRSLHAAIRYRYAFLVLSIGSLVAAGALVRGFERDFMPEMDEGSILYMPSTLPGLPGKEAGWILQRIDQRLKEFPEVERVFGKLGRADTSTDPAPTSMIETTVLLKPKSEWREGMTKAQLVAEMDAAMQFVGYVNTWVQPISARVMMQETGIQTPVGIKVKGAEIPVIEQVSQQIEALLREFPGTKSVVAERISAGYFIDVQFSHAKLAQYGIPVDEAMAYVRYAIGGENVVNLKQPGDVVVPMSVQYAPEFISTVAKVKTTPVIAPDGRSIPMDWIADVSVRKLPEMIRNDDGHIAGYVYVDLTGVTPTDYVANAGRFLAERLTLPAGYSVEWTGVYQYAERARAQLALIVPITLVIIFALLVMTFRSLPDSLLIIVSVPFATVGGVVLQWQLGYAMTTAVIIGYIALFAVAIQTGIVMIVFIRQALADKAANESDLDAIMRGSISRLRPKLMTVSVTIFSLFPVMLSSGQGMEIMKPIATPTVGGMVSSTLYVLFLIPCLFVIGQDMRRRWGGRPNGRMARARVSSSLPR